PVGKLDVMQRNRQKDRVCLAPILNQLWVLPATLSKFSSQINAYSGKALIFQQVKQILKIPALIKLPKGMLKDHSVGKERIARGRCVMGIGVLEALLQTEGAPLPLLTGIFSSTAHTNLRKGDR